MNDVISRQAAITIPVMPKEHRHYQTNNLDDAYEQGWNDLQECIENLPPAEPNHNADVSKKEIIHCKDCKYWKEKPLYTYCEKMYRMGILDVLDYATEENDFCSMAEKRGEADDEVGS